MSKTAPCGTYAGYQRHGREKSAPCEACRDANSVYHREWRTKRGVEYRTKEVSENAARSRALWRLADDYPETFAAYFAEEVAR